MFSDPRENRPPVYRIGAESGLARRHAEDHLGATPIKSGSSRYEQMKVAECPIFRYFATRVEPRESRPLQ